MPESGGRAASQHKPVEWHEGKYTACAVGCAKSPCESLRLGTASGAILRTRSISRSGPCGQNRAGGWGRFGQAARTKPRSSLLALQPCHNPVMSRYRRPIIEGGVFFFTLALMDRSSELLVQHIERFREVYRAVQLRLPFETNAICILPDHLHAIWTLPPRDIDFASRWSQIKSGFSRGLAPARLRSRSQLRRRETGIGSDGFGSTQSEMTRTSSVTSITSTSIR